MVKFQITNSKSQINSNNQIPIIKIDKRRIYDLEERTYQFSKNVTMFSKKLSNTISNMEYSKQVIRSSGSVGANYIEANESLSKSDFMFRMKICLKEAKESVYWLKLIICTNLDSHLKEGSLLQEEGVALKKIFSSIIENSR